jgi:hypothetical protein
MICGDVQKSRVSVDVQETWHLIIVELGMLDKSVDRYRNVHQEHYGGHHDLGRH